MRNALTEFVGRGGRLRVLAGGDSAQTEPKALQFFRQLGGNCEVRLVSSSGIEGFHPKCYIVYADDKAMLIVGSSNFTSGGLRDNMELNLQVDLPTDDETIAAAQRIFDALWEATPPLTDERFNDYARFWEQCHQAAAGFIYRPPEEGKVKVMEEFLDPGELKAGDLVQFNEQEGEVMAVTKLGDRWSVRLSVQGVGTKTLLSPPTQFQRIDTPMSCAKRFNFDSPTDFDLLTEATRLSLAYEYDRLVSLSNS